MSGTGVGVPPLRQASQRNQEQPPSAQRRSTHKRVSLDIRHILNCDDKDKIDSRDIEQHLQSQVRRLLQSKRKEQDEARAKLRDCQRRRGQLRTALQSLMPQAEALGVATKSERDPELETTVDSVSRRRVIVHDSHLRVLEARHRELKEALQGGEHKGRMYKHIRTRTATTLRELSQVVHDLEAEHREAELQEGHLAREETSARDEFGRAQQRLRALQEKIDADLRLWKLELADREEWVRQKAMFREMVRAQEKQQRELEATAAAGPASQLARQGPKAAATMLATKSEESKLTETLEAQQEEERRFEEAFRRIGAQTGEPNPSEVISTCMAQRALQRDLQEAEVRDRAKMRELEQQLESLRQEEQMARFDADATTNRVLAEREAAIERLEKRAAREKQDTRAVLQVVEPARTAVRGLAKTVLNTEKEVPVEAPANLAATLRRVESRVAALMGQASDLVQTLSDVEPAAEGREAAFSLRSLFAAAAALERIAAQESAKGEGGASRGATIAGPGMSPYNVRVRSLRSAEQEGDSAAVKAGAGDERDVNRMAAEGHEVPFEDRHGSDRVTDRYTLKRRAVARVQATKLSSPAHGHGARARPPLLNLSASAPQFR